MKPEIKLENVRGTPRGRCCFYHRFVRFIIISFHSANNRRIYQSAKSLDVYCMRDIFAHHYGSIGLNTEQYLTELFCMRRLFDAYFIRLC